jgi:hypothetical protein
MFHKKKEVSALVRHGIQLPIGHGSQTRKRGNTSAN